MPDISSQKMIAFNKIYALLNLCIFFLYVIFLYDRLGFLYFGVFFYLSKIFIFIAYTITKKKNLIELMKIDLFSLILYIFIFYFSIQNGIKW